MKTEDYICSAVYFAEGWHYVKDYFDEHTYCIESPNGYKTDVNDRDIELMSALAYQLTQQINAIEPYRVEIHASSTLVFYTKYPHDVVVSSAIGDPPWLNTLKACVTFLTNYSTTALDQFARCGDCGVEFSSKNVNITGKSLSKNTSYTYSCPECDSINLTYHPKRRNTK